MFTDKVFWNRKSLSLCVCVCVCVRARACVFSCTISGRVLFDFFYNEISSTVHTSLIIMNIDENLIIFDQFVDIDSRHEMNHSYFGFSLVFGVLTKGFGIIELTIY